MSTFEDRLWSELVREHADRMRLDGTTTVRRGRRPAVLTGTALGATGLAGAAALLVFGATKSTPAYAVTTHSDGTVTVTLNDVAAITALNAELTGDGIAAKAIPLTADCPVRGFPNPMPAGTNPSTYTITIDPRDIPAGYTAVVAVGETGPGRSCWPRARSTHPRRCASTAFDGVDPSTPRTSRRRSRPRYTGRAPPAPSPSPRSASPTSWASGRAPSACCCRSRTRRSCATGRP